MVANDWIRNETHYGDDVAPVNPPKKSFQLKSGVIWVVEIWRGIAT